MPDADAGCLEPNANAESRIEQHSPNRAAQSVPHSHVRDPAYDATSPLWRPSLQKRPQLAAAGRMPQLAQRLGLDLPDAFAGDREALADLLEGVLAAIADAEAHLDDLLLAGRERLQHRLGLLTQVQVDDRIRR